MTALPQPPWAPLSDAARAIMLAVLMRGPTPRSELARRIGLSAGSLTRLTAPLLESGLLVEAGPSRSGAGRPTRPLDIAADAHHFLGVKVTDEDAHLVVTDLRAQIVAGARAALPGHSPGDVVATVRREAGALARRVPELTAAGLSLGGQVADHATVTAAPFLHWTREVPLGALLTEALGVPSVVDNDLLALTRAEHWFGAGRGHDRFAVLTTGISVGYGLVVHDRIVDSPDAGLGLIAHLPLDPYGPYCPDGHRGCATAMLAAPSIAAAVSTGVRRPVSYEECLRMAADGDRVASPVVTAAAHALGRLITVVSSLTMARRVVLTGEGIGLAEVGREALEDGMRADRHAAATPTSYEIQPIDFSLWARGAAATAIQRFILGPEDG
ncbi:ROK family transcriptional regulator [Streptomyces sp. RKND-216]|uniref:ROK family transcriptional regulator n=1 Tax=Streptomyces sp. RKND-216 TaxID=2562581 RepID=UPI001FFB1E52|nr:ROK family transcriptional regulator [Streptomyces sp. RKND-216]